MLLYTNKVPPDEHRIDRGTLEVSLLLIMILQAVAFLKEERQQTILAVNFLQIYLKFC